MSWDYARYEAIEELGLVRAANGPLRDKVMFGSDYPVLTPDRWIASFDELDIKPEVRPLILKETARRVLGLAG